MKLQIVGLIALILVLLVAAVFNCTYGGNVWLSVCFVSASLFIGYYLFLQYEWHMFYEETEKNIIKEDDSIELKPGPIQTAWLKSLREHPERQTTKVLGYRTNGAYKACCLGELGLIAGVCTFDSNGTLCCDGSRTILLNYTGLGLRSPNGRQTKFAEPTLAVMNDFGKTWPEIADHVEKNFSLYFTKSV